MSKKAKDPKTVKQNISHKPIDYAKLNRLTEDFGKHFTLQQELSAEQEFWLGISNPSIESSYTPPVIIEVPCELPKVSLVNASGTGYQENDKNKDKTGQNRARDRKDR
ncbi:hypothetical protein Tco_0733162 [Tanacetum coccineum]